MKKILIPALAILLLSCTNNESKMNQTETVTPEVEWDSMHPEWSKNATIYELNIRQFSENGDFASILPHIPRLKEMGVKIIWLMPIHPIGELHRKGSLGSYYSVQDSTDVNPNYGTKEDFKALVEEIHAHDMKVIIDWVANHSAFDNPWTENETWYNRDEDGNPVTPVDDWSDVADLNYDSPEMRRAMIDALKYWVQEYDIDGYRCDVAMMVPTDFWNQVRIELDALKPVFMLAEAEEVDHHQKAFDMSYSWDLHHLMNDAQKGDKPYTDFHEFIKEDMNKFGKNAYRMTFTTNHDENSWNGTVFERFGDNHLNYAVLAFTVPGMPLVYSGQEAGLDHRLAFFDKDLIDWNDYPLQDFYTELLKLNVRNEALWNGEFGGSYHPIEVVGSDKVLAYYRKNGDDLVAVIINFDENPVDITLEVPETKYRKLFSDEIWDSNQLGSLHLEGNSHMILEKTE
jgi:cyclomaltodextrinase